MNRPLSFLPFSWLSTFYGTYFFSSGVYMPFCAIWLAWVGLPSDQIGLVLGVGIFTRFVATLLITPRFHSPHRYMLALRILTFSASFFGFLHFAAYPNLLWLLVLTVCINAAMGPTIPVSDAMTTYYSRQQLVDYGKVRLWGSLAFMVGSTVAGALIEYFGPKVFVWLIALPLFLSGCWTLLRLKEAIPFEATISQSRPSLLRVLKHPSLLIFFVLVSFIQSSHAAYYAFSAIYWTEQGLSDVVVGYLWSIGVLVEVGIFAMSRSWFGHWSIVQLFRFASLAVVVRWCLMSMTTDVALLMVIQGLHGVTFGVAHIATMRFIQQQTQVNTMALQALYSAIPLGAAMALMTVISGEVYQQFEGVTFSLMATFGVIAFLLTFVLVVPHHEETHV